MSSFTCNMRVLKTLPGFLKLVQIIIGLIFLGLFVSFVEKLTEGVGNSTSILFLGIFCYLFSTSLILISMLISPVTANTLPKTIFEFLYHMIGFVFFFLMGLALLIIALKDDTEGAVSEEAIALAVLGLLKSAILFVSTYYSFKSYREE